MAGSFFFNKDLIRDAVRRGLEDAIEEAAERVATDARRRAPIRKVFKEKKGYKRKTRALTEQERALAIKRAVAFYANDEFKMRRSVAHLRYYARVRLPDRTSQNNLSRSRKLRSIGIIKAGRFRASESSPGTFRNRMGGYEPGQELRSKLTSRGRYEVRSGRAVIATPSPAGTQQNVQIGGALKESIGAGPVQETGTGVEAVVEAAIRYAKFVEFPTIRTQAQPFLLPALHQERTRLVRDVANAIKKNLGG